MLSENPRAMGRLIVVSAPSGAGKSSLVDRALAGVERLRFSISVTTRPPRGQEKDGIDYYFVSEEAFRSMIEQGKFLEYAQVHRHYYGTPVDPINQILLAGEDVILDIDVKGAEQVRKRIPDAVTVFVLPPSRQALKDRLRSRNLNSADDLDCRMEDATLEVGSLDKFDYIVVNDDLESAAQALEAVVIADRHRLDRQRAIVQAIISTFGGN
jgi:guanylate kinase